MFFAASILLGLLCRLPEMDTVTSFVSGAAELLGVAFIIGISRGITVVMNAGRIIYDVSGEEKQKLTREDLLQKFSDIL